MKSSTKKILIEALERLVEGTPNDRDLRIKAQSGKLKINNSTVEKEAGLSVGALRNHADIKELIKSKSLKIRAENSGSASSEIELLLQENKMLKSEKTELNRLKKKHHETAKRNEAELAKQAAIHIKMVQELMDMIPEINREKAMDKIVSIQPNNVINGKFGE
ncbi:bacterioferritin comigratory protein [Vibrio tarriae]|uniref:bacterioferritin comigratory protein n=1 Tax=Vibrio TaxID=662 RepID=UPI000DE325E0|nr:MULTISPECIES: bacterioferritin comigratory protein [Vibrio]MDY7586791.1 bacterioferritin comigratory protein [Vibrio cholerae]RBM51298.1 bacterioferritin comigratory protein [Vibrio tarriae]